MSQRKVLPECSRLTAGWTVAALRRSRDALVDIDSELGDLLVRLRSSGAALDSAAPRRLADAKTRAVDAMAGLHHPGLW